MDGRKFQFLKAVLGDDGARALSKAAERAPELGSALLPRTIMAWLGVAARDDFEGTIPGVENTYLQFSKAEDKYTGSVSIGDDVYGFEAATVLHLGACMAVALGSDHERMSPRLKDLDIQRLGKNIDTIVKARVAIDELRKRSLDPVHGYSFSHEHQDLGGGAGMTKVHVHAPGGQHVGTAAFSHEPTGLKLSTVVVDEDHQRRGLGTALLGHAQKVTGKKIVASTQQTPEGQALWNAAVTKGEKKVQGGAEAPGPAHAATPPMAPLAPMPPVPSQTSKGPIVGMKPKPPKLPQPKAADDQIQTGTNQKQAKSKAPTLKVTKAQAERECSVCGCQSFEGGRYSGCVCMKELAKSTYTDITADGYVIKFGPDWDNDAILTLIESLGRT